MRELNASTRRLLGDLTARLAAEYDGVFEPRTVESVVEGSVERLGHVTVSRFVSLLVERFARERLLASAQHAGLIAKERPQLLFVCTHNAGRSQMAAAFARHASEGRVDVRSAGSDPSATVEGAVVAVMEELGIDMVFEYPKPLTYLDWHIADPAGRPIDEVRRIRLDIADHVLELLKEILQ